MMKTQKIKHEINSEKSEGEVQKDRLQSRRELKPGRCAWADCLEAGSSHCGRCRKSFYCSAAHQAKDWDIFHRFECIEESGKETLTPSTPSATPTPVSVASVNPTPLSATSTTKTPPTEKREKPAVKKINGFDPMTSVHPTSVGPDGVPPRDIWDTSNSPSICLDLKQVTFKSSYILLHDVNDLE
jgi:MYND finger